MSAVDAKFYQKKKQNMLYGAIFFLILVLLLSVGLYFYDSKIIQTNQNLQGELENIEASIAERQQISGIQSYKLYKRNQDFLEKQSCRSQVSDFITHMKRSLGKYGFEAKGFTLSGEKITTNISVDTNDADKAYQKIVDFLSEYPEMETSILNVEHIGNFSGYDTITFPLSLTFNEKMYENCAK